MTNENLLKLIDAVERHNAKGTFYFLEMKLSSLDTIIMEVLGCDSIITSEIVNNDLSNANYFGLEIREESVTLGAGGDIPNNEGEPGIYERINPVIDPPQQNTGTPWIDSPGSTGGAGNPPINPGNALCTQGWDNNTVTHAKPPSTHTNKKYIFGCDTYKEKMTVSDMSRGFDYSKIYNTGNPPEFEMGGELNESKSTFHEGGLSSDENTTTYIVRGVSSLTWKDGKWIITGDQCLHIDGGGADTKNITNKTKGGGGERRRKKK